MSFEIVGFLFIVDSGARLGRVAPASRFAAFLVLVEVAGDLLLDLPRSHAPSEGVDELALGVHEVKEDRVVDEVVLGRLRVWRRREVDSARVRDSRQRILGEIELVACNSLGLACLLDLVVRTRQSDERGVEVCYDRLERERRSRES